MAMSENKARSLRGELYYAFTPELVAGRRRCNHACSRYNNAGEITRRRQVELWNELVIVLLHRHHHIFSQSLQHRRRQISPPTSSRNRRSRRRTLRRRRLGRSSNPHRLWNKRQIRQECLYQLQLYHCRYLSRYDWGQDLVRAECLAV